VVVLDGFTVVVDRAAETAAGFRPRAVGRPEPHDASAKVKPIKPIKTINMVTRMGIAPALRRGWTADMGPG
jgi:hypothetical protein